MIDSTVLAQLVLVAMENAVETLKYQHIINLYCLED